MYSNKKCFNCNNILNLNYKWYLFMDKFFCSYQCRIKEMNKVKII